MKKFMQYFLIVPIIFIAIFTLFACGDDDINSINLSIPNYTETNGSYIIDKSELNQNSMGEKRVPLNVTISPSNYTINSLTIIIKNNNELDVVKEVRIREDNTFIIFGSAIGQSKITASYKRSDGKTISSTISLLVTDKSSSLRFSEYTYRTTYSGEQLEDNYFVIGDEEKNYNYTYYEIHTDKNNEQKEVDRIVDAGRYRITCTDPNNPSISTETFLIVDKYKFSFKANNYETYYGDPFPEGIYNESEAPENLLIPSNISVKTINGIGKDKNEIIGNMAEFTTAYVGADVGLYSTTVRMQIKTSAEKNYETKYDVEQGSIRIRKKEVILKGANETCFYGDSVSHNFVLYSYSEYLEKGEDVANCTPLGQDKNNKGLNFAKDVSLGDIVYKNLGTVVNTNDAGKLNVLYTTNPQTNLKEITPYEVCFDNATAGINLIIKGKVSGSLLVEPRDITILPTKNQSKVYGTEDPDEFTYSVVAGSTVNFDNIENPLRVSYRPSDEGYGTGNYLADAGEYYFTLNDDLNPNYNINLHNKALEDSSEADKITYRVLPCLIKIKFEDKTERYKKPASQYHSVGYFGDAEDYKLDFEYVKVNGKEVSFDTVESGTLGSQGRIDLPAGGRFYIAIAVDTNIVKNTNYFLTYKINLTLLMTEGVVGTNYINELEDSYLNLTKSTVTIYPKETVKFGKTYDGVAYDEKTDTTALFENGYSRYYIAKDESGKEVDLDTILSDAGSLLTLIKGESYYKLNANGEYEGTTILKDVGSYKMFLVDEFNYINNMEYYDIVLDQTKNYNYIIDKAPVSITPLLGQSKVYGAEDVLIRYEWSNLPNNEQENPTGELERESGEDVGDYAISLGTLDFGENYKLSLNISNQATFKIIPRTITVKPYSYSYIYGDSGISPQYNYTIEDGYSDDILVAPKFIGEFTILYDRTDEESVVPKDGANCYPVRIDKTTKNILSYAIGQGAFGTEANTSGTNNYRIVFDNQNSTYTITKRNIEINITPQRVTSDELEEISAESFVLNTDYYVITNIVGNVSKELKVSLNTSSNYFCSVDRDSYELKLIIGEDSVYDNYSVELGANIVYRIEMTVVYLSIIDKALYEEKGTMQSTIETVYNGDPVEDAFMLISTNNNYEVHSSSTFKFKFLSSFYNEDKPTDAGNYVVNIDLTDGDLVIRNKLAQSEETELITFDKAHYNTMVGNIVVNISSFGYLNITRATIKAQTTPEFADDFVYGDTYLPKLKTYGSKGSVFVDVKGREAQLKTYDVQSSDGGYLNYVASAYSTSNFQAGYTYSLMVSVQKTTTDSKTGQTVIDTNYETLVIPSVKLKVKHREMQRQSSEFILRSTGSSNLNGISYNGIIKSLNLKLILSDSTLQNNFTTTYSYQRLAVTYGDKDSISGEARVTCRSYNGDDNFGDTTSSVLFKNSTLKGATNVQIKKYLGNRYVVYGNLAYLIESDEDTNVSPLNAGVYVCIATCNAYDNYTFVTDIGTTSSSVQYSTVFEIEKSSEIIFNEENEASWKKEFFYTERFNFLTQELPFVYQVSPSFLNEYVVFSMDSYADLSPSYYLNVKDNYTVNLTINTDNYYRNWTPSFSVKSLQVDFVFPALKNYEYLGEGIRVTSFLSNIRVIKRDSNKNAVETFYYDPYSSQSADIVLTYYDSDGNIITDDSGRSVAPYKIGDYLLKMSYGSGDGLSSSIGNYSGKGEFDYSIVKRTFTNSISANGTTMPYNPLYTQEQLYKEIKKRMFTIGLDESEYDLTMYMGTTVDEAMKIEVQEGFDFKNITSPEQLGWLREINKAGPHNITFVVDFHDTEYDPFIDTATLTIKKISLTLDDFDLDVDVNNQVKEYIYNGLPKYNYIYYGKKEDDIFLNPDSPDYDRQVGEYFYHFRSHKDDGYVELLDNMFNTIFKLRYSYETRTGTPLNTAPSDPDERYKVNYNITGGDNYATSGLEVPHGLFTITKIEVLYLSIRDLSNLILRYTGSNLLTGDVYNRGLDGTSLTEYLVVRTADSSTGLPNEGDEKEVKYTLYFNEEYKEEYGFYLEVYFTNSEGKIVNEIIETGEYKMHFAVAYAKKYNIADYFDYVEISTTKERMATSEMRRARNSNGDYEHWYDFEVSETFVVSKGESIYTAEEYTDVFGFKGLAETPQGSNWVIVVNTSSNQVEIRIQDDKQEEITLQIRIKVGNRFRDLTEVVGDNSVALDVKDASGNYNTYQVVIKSKNYEDTTPIEIRFTT